MPYYHIRITQKGRTKDAIELNLTERKLVGLILEKYRLREKFACGNELVNPADVLGMKITKSEQPLGLGHPDYFRLEYRDLWRKVEAQEDVTKKFAGFIPEPIPNSQNVFIVHGRDHKPMKELKTMLKDLGLNPIVLHEQPSGSRTIVEKLEKYSDVGYAFVILTRDDVGCLEEETSEVYTGDFRDRFDGLNEVLSQEDMRKLTSNQFYDQLLKYCAQKLVILNRKLRARARQNVILEFGYFIGLLGRDKVCCLHTGDVELPSDMQGIVYIPFKESVDEARDKIIKELKEAGYELKM